MSEKIRFTQKEKEIAKRWGHHSWDFDIVEYHLNLVIDNTNEKLCSDEVATWYFLKGYYKALQAAAIEEAEHD